MTKFLFVTGDTDYDAMMFDDSEHTPESVYEMMKESNTTTLTLEIEDFSVNFRLLEFGEVDVKFENFILSNLCDYDSLKATNVYRINTGE